MPRPTRQRTDSSSADPESLPLAPHQGPAGPRRAAGLILSGAAALLVACGSTPDGAPAAAVAAARPGSLQHCEALAGRFQYPGTRLATAQRAAAGAVQPGMPAVGAHCVVSGAMNERTGAGGLPLAIGFEMRLPQDWNGRFWYQANGGIDGTVHPALGALGGGPVTSALSQGFAVISSDAGHDNKKTRGPGFGLDPQARLDYGYQAVGSLTPMAKALIAAAYGRGPDTSYIGGCSNGGRHALVAASRYASQYDGFVAGAPGYRLPLAAVANLWGAQRYATVATDPKDLGSAFTRAERRLVADAVLARCDALDGLKDGLVQDSAACQKAFNLQRDLPTCAGERDGRCLSAAQKSVIAGIFDGATTRGGQRFYSSFPFDTGLPTADVERWEFTAPLQLDSGAVGLIFGVPPQNPKGFDGPAFAMKADVDALLASVHATGGEFRESAMAFMTPPNDGDLESLRRKGGKLLVYHGVSDAIFSAHDTEAWLQRVRDRSGNATDGFARLFEVPGMTHCRNGAATDQFDAITAIVRWVEQGQAPDRIEATARRGVAGEVNADVPADWPAGRTRPLCPFPKVARYQSGDPERASSFRCE